MSFLKKLAPNKPIVSLEGYFIAMLAKSKFGKTTFSVDLANEFYGNLDSTLLLAPEIGYKTMADVFAIPITGFDYAENDDGEQKGFIETIDELIENKNDIPFRFIIIDTITALERYAITYVLKKANLADAPKKRYTDISDIPWGKGYTMVAEEIYKQVDRLKKNNFGVFIIGHEKTKKITNRDGFEYDYTTFNVLGKTSDIIEREADMIVYGDLQVEETKTGQITTRKLKFRSDGNILCGTRFRNFPSELDNDATVFIDAFKNTVLDLYNGSAKDVEKARIEQEKAVMEKAEKLYENEKEKSNNSTKIDVLIEEIQTIVRYLPKTKRQSLIKPFTEILGDADIRKSNDVEALSEALELVKSLAQ